MLKKSSLILILVFLFAFSADPILADADVGGIWLYTHYDLQGILGSMELDSNDLINILYIVPTPEGDEFRFAKQTSGDWEIEIVATVTDTSSFDLALDSTNNPYFVFRNRTAGTNNLGYYKKAGTSWTYEGITDPGSYPEDPILQIDNAGHPHIVYEASGFHYLFWDGIAWLNEFVSDSGGKAWLVLDSDDNPSIALANDSNDIEYFEWDIDHWIVQEVDDTGILGLYLSLALDQNDQPHIAYWDFQNGNLKYAHRGGESEWDVSTVGGSGRVPTIDIDSAGHPHITSFTTLDFQYLQYSFWNGEEWLIELVESYPDVVGGSLRLTKTDQPRIIITQCDMVNGGLLPQKILFKGSMVFIPLVVR